MPTTRSSVQGNDVSKIMALVDSIDLSMVRRNLIKENGWSEETAEQVELRYRRFLCLHYIDRECPLVPAKDIDLFWHQHILHTRAYAVDCNRLFGEFLHHTPASGNDDDAGHLREAFGKTRAFYADLFGEEYAAGSEELDAAKPEHWLRLFS
jgi:hypothetical protein